MQTSINPGVLAAIMAAIPHSAPPPTLGFGASSQGKDNFTNACATTAVTTAATGSTFVLGIVRSGVDTITSITDNKGNSFVLRASGSFNSGNQFLYLYDCVNGAGGAGHVFTVNWSGFNQTLVFTVELTGAPVFDQFGALTSVVNAFSITTSTITTPSACAVVAFCGFPLLTMQTSITDSFANVFQTVLDGVTYNLTGAIAGKIQSVAGSISDTFTLGSMAVGASFIASWK